MRSHLLTTARCDRIFLPQPSAIAFSYHSHLRSHFPTTAICDRIFLPQPSAIAFSHHSHLRSHFPTTAICDRIFPPQPIPDSRFPIPDSRFPILNSQFSILNSQFPVVSPVQGYIFPLGLKIVMITGYSTEKQRELLPKYHLQFLKLTIAMVN
ncbi:MAG: hypothetical protein F6K63_16530 [Moorea sp. SIO1G6]|uniref:hypothetical protein n=1 Tax=Moorena sp. SIO1G6 TaxID=2607840 RepID=UPI0013C21041|nr:hypothetical protein [Moorena sp. SIO1G6]NET65905.1 hypothetical protein [Moorena sp. SIO1G6]